MIRSGDPWAGLDEFHRAALDFIAGLQEREAQARWSEIRRSSTHEAAVIESVSARLAAAAGASPAVATRDVGEAGLLDACRAVGEALGIAVRSAPSSVRSGGWIPAERRARGPGAGLRVPHAAGDPARGMVAPPAASRSWAGSPTRAAHAGPSRLLPAARPAAVGGAVLQGPAARRSDRPGGSGTSRPGSPPGLALLPTAPRRPPRGSLTSSRFCRGLRGLGRELVMVLATGVRRRTARPVDPRGRGHTRGSGDPRVRSVRLCAISGRRPSP